MPSGPKISSMRAERLEREKWAQELEWRREEINLRRQELATSRRGMWVSGVAIAGSVLAAVIVSTVASCTARTSAETAAVSARLSAESAASSALASAQLSAGSAQSTTAQTASATIASAERSARATLEGIDRRWRLEIIEEQRKSTVAAAEAYLAAFEQALDLAEGVTSRAVRGERPDRDAMEAYDRQQRENIIAMSKANGRLLFENLDVAYVFVPYRRWFQKLDTDILGLGRAPAGLSDVVRQHAWCRLHLRLRRVNLATIINETRGSLARAGISPPSLNERAPPMSIASKTQQLEPDTAEELRVCGAPMSGR